MECGGEIEVAAGSGAASDVAKVGAPVGVDAGVAKDKRDKGVQTNVTSSLVSSYARTVANGLVQSGEVKSQTYPSHKEKGEKVKAGHQSGVWTSVGGLSVLETHNNGCRQGLSW